MFVWEREGKREGNRILIDLLHDHLRPAAWPAAAAATTAHAATTTQAASALLGGALSVAAIAALVITSTSAWRGSAQATQVRVAGGPRGARGGQAER